MEALCEMLHGRGYEWEYAPMSPVHTLKHAGGVRVERSTAYFGGYWVHTSVPWTEGAEVSQCKSRARYEAYQTTLPSDVRTPLASGAP